MNYGSGGVGGGGRGNKRYERRFTNAAMATDGTNTPERIKFPPGKITRVRIYPWDCALAGSATLWVQMPCGLIPWGVGTVVVGAPMLTTCALFAIGWGQAHIEEYNLAVSGQYNADPWIRLIHSAKTQATMCIEVEYDDSTEPGDPAPGVKP